MKRRILSIWLPRLATDRLARLRIRSAPPPADAACLPVGRPVATVTRERGALVLAAIDAIAEARGLVPGLGFAEARAQVPDLEVDAHDGDADAALLSRIAGMCERYTPLVAISDPDGLFLDVTGCTHLFEGEAPLRRDLCLRLSRQGFAVRAAIAGTPGAAWALARHGEAADDPVYGCQAAKSSDRYENKEGSSTQASAAGPTSETPGTAPPSTPDRKADARTACLSPSGPSRRAQIATADAQGGRGAGSPGRQATPSGPQEGTGGAAMRGDPRRQGGGSRHRKATLQGHGPIIPDGAEAAALAPLPVAALRLPEEMPPVLQRLGIRTVAALDAQPRAGLARRFGPMLLQRLDGALGRSDEPIDPRLPAPALLIERRFAEPLFARDAVAAVLSRLAKVLCKTLEMRGEGARRLAFTLFGTDGSAHRLEAGGSTPLVTPERIVAVFAPRLEAFCERLESDAGIDLVRLSALEAGPADPVQSDLDGRAAAAADLARLVDTLSARLGADAVRRLLPCDVHDPAAAVEARAAIVTPPVSWQMAVIAPNPDDPPDRPLRMLTRPEPVETIAAVPEGPPLRFRWRKVAYAVAAAEGPERIAAAWWQDGHAAATRDYFRIEDVEGRRFWLFRHGLYGRETDRPGWFVHGVFA